MERGYQIDADGRAFKTAPRGDYTDKSIQRLDAEGRIHRTRTGTIRIKYFLRQEGGHVYDKKLIGSVWQLPDMMHAPRSERTGYPTQKPLALLERIVKASSNEGDVVLDPFCGCATTCIAAEKLGRQWAGIDLSPKAAELVKVRMRRGRTCSIDSTRSFELIFPSVQTLVSCHHTRHIATHSTANKKGTARAASITSRSATSLSTTSSQSQRAVQTTWTTYSCSAEHATR